MDGPRGWPHQPPGANNVVIPNMKKGCGSLVEKEECFTGDGVCWCWCLLVVVVAVIVAMPTLGMVERQTETGPWLPDTRWMTGHH